MFFKLGRYLATTPVVRCFLFLMLINCTTVTAPSNTNDYKIKILNAFANLRSGRLEYGFTVQNEAITDATQLEIIVRFSFNDSLSKGSQEGLITETSTLGIGESTEITSTLNDSDVKSPYTIEHITKAQVVAIHFYNIAESPEMLAELTYQGVEGNIPIIR